MIVDKQLKIGDCEFLLSGKTMACKWMDNWLVLLLSYALEEINDILSAQRIQKCSKTKSQLPCPKFVNLCNSGIGGVDLMDQPTASYIWIESHLLDFTSAFSLV